MTYFFLDFCYHYFGDIMKVKLFDESHEKDLEESINNFISGVEVIDIKYQVAISVFAEEQIFCFSAMIIYKG